MTSIIDVAKRAGVSISTVSNVVNGTKPVSPELGSKVLQAIEELGYKPNQMASGLKSRKTRSIGVIINSTNPIFFTQVLQGIHDVANELDYRIVIYLAGRVGLEAEQEYVHALIDSWIDGIIMLTVADPAIAPQRAYLQSIAHLVRKNKQIPIVSLERIWGDIPVDAVMVDNVAASKTAVQHLLDLGHRKIACIAGEPAAVMSGERLQGYLEALAGAGIVPPPAWTRIGDFSATSGYTRMCELLRETNITAVFAANDQMAIGAIKAIKEAGLKIPEDIAVVGFDNIFPGSLIAPALTSIHVPRYKLGFQACEMLIRRIDHSGDGPAEKQVVYLPTQLIIRQSTDLRGENAWDLVGW